MNSKKNFDKILFLHYKASKFFWNCKNDDGNSEKEFHSNQRSAFTAGSRFVAPFTEGRPPIVFRSSLGEKATDHLKGRGRKPRPFLFFKKRHTAR